MPPRRRKRRRLGVSAREAAGLRAERPNQVWALGFPLDTTTGGRPPRPLRVVDEHTREALAIQAERRIGADRTVSVLERIVAERGRSPELLRMDNGPELTANALRDWSRFGGSGTSYIEPGPPWQNPFVESFDSRVRDEVLAVEAFDSPLEAKTVIEDSRNTYNTQKPHSSLDWQTPAAYTANRKTD